MMIRRRMILFVLAAILAAPQVSGALPRPEGVTQTGPEQQMLWPSGLNYAVVSGTDSVGILTPVLQQNRQYRLEVTGTWKPSTSPTNNADAAFETTNGTNWSKTGRGLVIRATNMGDPNKPPSSYRSDHKYSLSYVGRGVDEVVRLNDPQGYSDNSGSVTVKIFVQQIVVWEYQISQPLPTSPGVPKTDKVSYPLNNVPTSTTTDEVKSPTDIGLPNTGLPELARADVIFTPSGQGDSCATFKLTVVGTAVPVGLGCSGFFNGQPNQSMTVGGPASGSPFVKQGDTILGKQSIPTFKEFVDCLDGDLIYNIMYPATPRNACNNELVIIPDQPGGPLPIQPIPPGSSLRVTGSWRADLTRLWYTPLNDGAGTGMVLPFNPISSSDRDWFVANVAILDLRIDMAIIGPGGSVIYRNPTISVPAVGQYIEAAFANSVAGI